MLKKGRIYLDYAASTPVSEGVLEVMEPYFTERYGNAGSLHSFGQEAIAGIDKSREIVAGAIGAHFREIIFTGSATEANNLVLRGVVKGINHGKKMLPRVIVSSIEHDSVLKTAKDLEMCGEIELVILSVDLEGVVDLKKLKESLNDRTAIVSVMYGNNEIGTVQPVSEVAEIVREFRGTFSDTRMYPLIHTDAAQAFQYLDCNVDRLGVDFMTLSGQKMFGPKGVGALFVRSQKRESVITPLITGGGQEFGFRSGTENAPLVVGFSQAVQETVQLRDRERKRIFVLRSYFWKGLKRICPGIEINGPSIRKMIGKQGFESSLPHILNVRFPLWLAQDLLIRLDIAGVAVSAGSACAMRSLDVSHVLTAIGLSEKKAFGSLRFSFGRFTTEGDIKEVLRRINGILNP